MASSRERFEERQYLHQGEVEIAPETYNLIIGGVLLYGFLINCFMVAFCSDAAMSLMSNYGLFLIMYFVMVLVGSFMIHGSSNPVVSFIGYNFIVIPLGLVLSVTLNAYVDAGFSTTITVAFAITAVVTLVMMFVSSLFPNFFLSIGKTLFLSLLVTVIVELVCIFLNVPLGIIDGVVVLIFCGYIGYDWARANTCAKTVDNAVDSASELYIDIINLFLRILRILARSRD